MEKSEGMLDSLKGIVQTLEQKSGLNPLLFLDAIFGIPSIAGFAFSGKTTLLWFAATPLAITILFYALAFFIDRNFLRSEKHVREMRQLEVLGEKGNEIDEDQLLNLPASADPSPDTPMLEGKIVK